MLNKNVSRQRRARKTRARIADKKKSRLSIHRTNQHIYAQVISACGSKILASASTLESDLRKELKSGCNVEAASLIGKSVAERAVIAGVAEVAFDRSGNKYHGRVKALAEAAREHGLKF